MDIDYAKVAEAYGCKSYTVRTMEELVAAFEDSRKVKNIPVLFDIKVLPKTMTDGYSSWWRVGDTEVSERKENLTAYAAPEGSSEILRVFPPIYNTKER